MAFDQTNSEPSNEDPTPDFLKDLSKVFAKGELTNALKEDLETLASFSDTELENKGLTRSRVERAVRRKHIQSLYG